LDDFTSDLEENLDATRFARAALLETVIDLNGADLRRERRGGWSVQEVLRHLIDSEVAYANVIGYLRGMPTDLARASDDDIASGPAAARALERVRASLLTLIDGVDEATFYDLRPVGKERYSILSVLENVASHDQEHLHQISKTLALP
jgi:hypothetical protein